MSFQLLCKGCVQFYLSNKLKVELSWQRWFMKSIWLTLHLLEAARFDDCVRRYRIWLPVFVKNFSVRLGKLLWCTFSDTVWKSFYTSEKFCLYVQFHTLCPYEICGRIPTEFLNFYESRTFHLKPCLFELWSEMSHYFTLTLKRTLQAPQAFWKSKPIFHIVLDFKCF